MIKKSNEIDNMNVGNVSHIDFQDGRQVFLLQITYIHILAQRRDRYDVAGNIHVFRVKESNEIDNMDVDNGSHIDFQDGRHLCYFK